MRIPYQQLDADTLEQLIEHFVLQEGTDYGEEERSLSEKVEDVRTQLQDGSAVIVFSELHESVHIVPADQVNGDEGDL